MLRAVNKLSSSQARLLSLRLYTQQQGPSSTNPPASAAQPAINPNVPGLSENCVAVPNQPVGPCAAKDKEYKNPEYFCYHVNSFAEAEVEMAKFRLPAPSNKETFTRNL